MTLSGFVFTVWFDYTPAQAKSGLVASFGSEDWYFGSTAGKFYHRHMHIASELNMFI